MNVTRIATKETLAAAVPDADVAALTEELEINGAVRLPQLVCDQSLEEMQRTFANRLRFFKCNNVDGYERTERMRLMVQDVLVLSQGFVDVALHPLVTAVIEKYCGPHYELCEAKGWQTQPTKKDFHGWHGDAWYDQTKVTDTIPREVKLAVYLSGVKSGAFQYLRGTHGKQAPSLLQRSEVAKLPLETMVDFVGPAGTAVLFDTSGIHRQGIPILEPRQAVFYNYHDPDVPLQQEDLDYYRYHPLLLNAALLGGLTPEQLRILGFGNKTHFQPHFVREPSNRHLHRFVTNANAGFLHLSVWSSRAGRTLSKLTRAIVNGK